MEAICSSDVAIVVAAAEPASKANDTIVVAASNEETSATSGKRKPSDVWDHFIKPAMKKNEEKDKGKESEGSKSAKKAKVEDPNVTCRYCNAKLVCCAATRTHALWNHHKICAAYKRAERSGQTQISASMIAGSNEIQAYKVDQERSREDVARFIICCDHPFFIVDNFAFRTLLSNLRPEFIQHKRATVIKDCIKIFLKEKDILKNELAKAKGRISLTSDMWTSVQTKGYMSLTAHFIDDNWKLQKKILNFLAFNERHIGVIRSMALEKCLLDWKINDKLFSITLDNASNNNVIATNLKERFRSSLPISGQFFHMRCYAHILNLIVKEGLKEMDASIGRIRDAIKFVTSSPQRLKIFEDISMGLSSNSGRRQMLDCPTKWNSTYHMLEGAVQCREEFFRFNIVERFNNPPSDNDWYEATELCKFLKVFDDSTNAISSTHIPTSNIYFMQVCQIEMHLRKTWENSKIVNMQVKMKEKFAQYWDEYSTILSIASVFDPRYKLVFVDWCLSEVYGKNMVEHMVVVQEHLKKLFGWYSSRVKVDISTVSTLQDLQQGSVIGASLSESSFCVENLLRRIKSKMRSAKKFQSSKTELDLYLEEEVHPDGEGFDILKFWSVNEYKYPILASMARDILAIPMSTVASESTFSIGSRVISDTRSHLKASTIEALICAQDWLRGTFIGDID